MDKLFIVLLYCTNKKCTMNSFIHAFLTVIPKQKVKGKNHLLFTVKAEIEDYLGMIIILCMLDEIVGLSSCSLSSLI